eukprot:1500679-Rhodomonas_salina.1
MQRTASCSVLAALVGILSVIHVCESVDAKTNVSCEYRCFLAFGKADSRHLSQQQLSNHCLSFPGLGGRLRHRAERQRFVHPSLLVHDRRG